MRTFLNNLRRWLRIPNGRFGDVITHLLSVALLAGFLWVIAHFSKIHPSDQVRAWIVILIGIAALGVGSLGGLLGLQSFFKAKRDRLKREVDDLNDQLGHLTPVYKRLLSLSVYMDDFQNLLFEGLLSNGITIEQLVQGANGEVENALCELPSKLMTTGTDFDVSVSIWLEVHDQQGAENLKAVLGPNHKGDELKQFTVPLERSWVYRSTQRPGSTSAGTPMAVIDDLMRYDDGSADLNIFRDMEYRSVRALAADVGGETVRLVALSKAADAFSDVENVYLLFLWCALNIAASRVPPQGEQSAPQAAPAD